MRSYPRALSRLVLSMSVPLLALCPAHATTRSDNGPRSAALKPVAPNDTIIPLPLTPIVPAGQRLCASRTPSGLGYSILRPANGPKPSADDTVLVNYIGYLSATGTVFDQSMQSPMPVGGVIPGFSEGLQLIGRGGVVRLCVPSALGYGAQASGPIPANSDLIFQIEMLDFKTAAEIAEMRRAGMPQSTTPPTQP
ncbi:FKBP-type peptidyl-prolyl cis-trans isomerase [Sphingomonas sanguinis]|nr:FKBP-type peptidyl-prolyl cis-trans isomerase [Sphingomonas sp. LC-1]